LIPNIRALRGVGAMTTETLKEYHDVLTLINEDIGEGSSMIEGYNEKVNTLGQQWKQFTGNLKKSVTESDRVNRAALAAQILFTLLNRTMSETVDLIPKIGEMEERLAIVAKEEADRFAAEEERLRKIEQAKKDAEEAKNQRIEAEKKDWIDKLAMITEEEEIKQADAEFDQWQFDQTMAQIDAEMQAKRDAANEEREITERRMEQEEKERKIRAELRRKELEEEYKAVIGRINAFKNFASEVGIIIEDVLVNQEKGFKELAKQMILLGLKELKTVADMAVAKATMQSLASAESIATWGIAGFAKAAMLAIAIESAYGIARGLIMAKMAKGGQVKGLGDKDTVPIMATPGEGVINKRSMQSQDVLTLTGRPFDIASQINSYKGFGIPFATGGVVPNNTYNTYNQIDESMINRIIDTINTREIKVYQNVNELIEAQNEINVIQKTGEL